MLRHDEHFTKFPMKLGHVILVMAEIPNSHLGCKKTCNKLPINWCRISSINSKTSPRRFFAIDDFPCLLVQNVSS